MKCNVGKTDRSLRIIVGAVILLAGLAAHNWLGIVGLVLIGTGLIRWCPAYIPLGINTDKESNS